MPENRATGSPEPPGCTPASHTPASDGRTGSALGRHLLRCAGATPALIESAAMASSSRALSHEAASAQRSEAEDILVAKRQQLQQRSG